MGMECTHCAGATRAVGGVLWCAPHVIKWLNGRETRRVRRRIEAKMLEKCVVRVETDLQFLQFLVAISLDE